MTSTQEQIFDLTEELAELENHDDPTYVDPNQGCLGGKDYFGKVLNGPPIRLEYAARIVCALLTAQARYAVSEEKFVVRSLELADKLIAEHNRTRKKNANNNGF
jgi:hypothetical protein